MSDTHSVTTNDKPVVAKVGLLDRFGVKEFLALLIVVALIVAILLFWFKSPEENNQILIGLIGALTAQASLVLNHYFGSTTQSHAKDETIAALAKPQA